MDWVAGPHDALTNVQTTRAEMPLLPCCLSHRPAFHRLQHALEAALWSCCPAAQVERDLLTFACKLGIWPEGHLGVVLFYHGLDPSPLLCLPFRCTMHENKRPGKRICSTILLTLALCLTLDVYV